MLMFGLFKKTGPTKIVRRVNLLGMDMLIERSELIIKDGLEDDFAATMSERGIPLLSNVPGVSTVQFGRGVENPGKFMLLVEWAAMDAHAAFRSNPVILSSRSY
jgi:Antibiotic biosynthesis monooxygenase